MLPRNEIYMLLHYCAVRWLVVWTVVLNTPFEFVSLLLLLGFLWKVLSHKSFRFYIEVVLNEISVCPGMSY